MKIFVATVMACFCVIGLCVPAANAKNPPKRPTIQRLTPSKPPSYKPVKPPTSKRPPIQRLTPNRPTAPKPVRPPVHHRPKQPPVRNTPSHRVLPGYNPGSGPVVIPRRPPQKPPVRHERVQRYPVYIPQQPIVIWNNPSNNGGWSGNSGSSGTSSDNTGRVLSLSRGDVILAINGESVDGRNDCIRMVNSSSRIMNLTVQDSRDGMVWQMQTRLRNRGSRFGVNLRDNPGGGAYVTSVFRGYPSTRCHVLGGVQ